MKRDLEPLRNALPMLQLCEREGLVFKRSAGNFVAPCPFHEERTSSFTIHGKDPHSAHCYGCGGGWDIFQFFAEKHGLSLAGKGFGEVVDQLSSLCGILPPRPDVQLPAAPPKRKMAPSILDEPPPRLPELHKFRAAHIKALAELRGYSLDGLQEAVHRGYLHFSYWPLDRSGQEDSRSRASWCVTDGSRRVAQFRRMDGGLYDAGKGKEGIKAWSTKGVPWLVGCEDVTPETELVLLVEGGADFLAAWSLIASVHAENVAVCCIFGSGNIAPECRAMLRGKRVRIIMDVDSPRTLKRGKKELQIRPGTEAAAKWSGQLTECGALVDVYSLEGLTCLKNGESRPVGDLNDLLLMEDAGQVAAIAAQILSSSPVSDPLPGESAVRIGTARRPDPDSAADFFPGPPPEPETAPSTPHIPEEETPAPAPQEPTLAEILAANERREFEAVIRKFRAGVLLNAREKALIRRMETAQAEKAAEPPEGGLPPEGFIDKVCQDLNVWWVNGDGSVFQVGSGSQWRIVPQEALLTMLQKRGISDKVVSGSLVPQTRDSIVHIMDQRILDRAVEGIAGFRPGIHQFKFNSVLVRKGPLIMEPKEGDCPLIHEILMAALGLDGVEGAKAMVQYERFNYWLARVVRNIHQPGEEHLPSQILMMAGPAGSRKSFIQHLILTPILGGRSADPSLYIFGESSFNEGWAACEHLLIEDPRPNVRTHDRLLFAQVLKGLAVNQERTLHGKHKSEFTIPNRFTVSLTINDDPDSIRILPKLTGDFKDKVMLFKIRPFSLSLPGRTAQQKSLIRRTITEELPMYLNYLLNLEVPEELHDPNERFNVAAYHHPELAQLLGDDTPESELLDLLDHVTLRLSDSGIDRSLWETDDAHDAKEYLEKHALLRSSKPQAFLQMCAEQSRRVWIGSSLTLQDLMAHCKNTRSWSKVADHNAIARLLLRLAEDRPDRVCFYKTKTKRFWLIAEPMCVGENDEDSF